MELLCPTACGFMLNKDYKNCILKIVFPICGINFRIRQLTCPLIDHRITTNLNISLKSLYASFLIISSISFWSYIFWSITCWLWSSSWHPIQAGVPEPKIIFLCLMMVSLMASSSSAFVIMSFNGVYSNYLQVLTAMSCSFIISFVTPSRLQKSFWPSFYTLKKFIIIIIITQHAALLVFCIGLFKLFNIYLRMKIFTLLVCRINL